jgi:DNA-binding beta-propeller fold protein YncE
MRQVHFSTADQRSVDLLFFVNGLPVATAELKTDFTQIVFDAITQYKTSRLPKDQGTGAVQVLFVSGARALVHFAVSNDEVWMTTKLAGDVFVTGRGTNPVVKLAAGSSAPTVLPFTDLNTPLSVAVDRSGNVYVAGRGGDSVLKLAP